MIFFPPQPPIPALLSRLDHKSRSSDIELEDVGDGHPHVLDRALVLQIRSYLIIVILIRIELRKRAIVRHPLFESMW